MKELDIDWEKVGEETDETMKDMKKSMDEGFLEEYEELVKVEEEDSKKSRKIVVPSTAVPQYGSQRYYTKQSITIRRDGCVKFSAGLCQVLLGLRGTSGEFPRDRIHHILSEGHIYDGKVWFQMDTEIEYGIDTRKRIRLEHEYDDRGIRKTKRYGEIYLYKEMYSVFEPLLDGYVESEAHDEDGEPEYVDRSITSVEFVNRKDGGLRIDNFYKDKGRTYTMIELDTSVVDWENTDSKMVRRNPDISKRASLEEHFVDEEIED